MEVIPAIDIRGGRCVRLHQGDYALETVFDDDPVAVARRWAEQGASRIHVVDLDGARDGRQANADIVRAIAATVWCPVQTGGGIRDLATLRATIEAGVQRVVLGTAAVKDPALLREAIALAGDRLIVSVDVRDGKVRTEGWTEGSDLDARAWIEDLSRLGVTRIVYTDISRDGAMDGPNLEAYAALARESSLAIIAAGGVTSVEDVRSLAATGIEAAIIGRALYTGDIALPAAIGAARSASEGR
ncbi:MAG: 1-(5-phosphoribosyl)-5-[(5-phosphoribosylamino)methylideneamino]imidazole-4-carboxamide isomerase [Dehalococcoidia bacterium]|nr:1-(5-phosphoribosyl)-5-[(5-phosphoribosylamino)methylideneamino]imidazole-4-carboxamide isomerase [Dehalococcoidia bacterium]